MIVPLIRFLDSDRTDLNMLNESVKNNFVVSVLFAVWIGGMPLVGLAQESPLTVQLQESPSPGTLLDVHFQDAQHGWPRNPYPRRKASWSRQDSNAPLGG